ncbi:MAG: hypothetical protein J3Q66DRAFT_421547 [Benniella sp.]|nr:MAG: hypothetical protein J3Q66DRAFT_421547 [Benniella sp.]
MPNVPYVPTMEKALVTLTALPAPIPRPMYAIPFYGLSEPVLSTLTDVHSRIQREAGYNRLVRYQIYNQLMLLEGATEHALIQAVDGSIPCQLTISNYMEKAWEQLENVASILETQKRALKKIDARIQEAQQRVVDTTSKANTTHNNNNNQSGTIVKLPSSVIRFKKNGSRNAHAFLRMFFTEIEALSTSYDPNDVTTMGRYLSLAIEDVSLANAFNKEFDAAVNAKKPAFLTMDELSVIFINNCDKSYTLMGTIKRPQDDINIQGDPKRTRIDGTLDTSDMDKRDMTELGMALAASQL